MGIRRRNVLKRAKMNECAHVRDRKIEREQESKKVQTHQRMTNESWDMPNTRRKKWKRIKEEKPPHSCYNWVDACRFKRKKEVEENTSLRQLITKKEFLPLRKHLLQTLFCIRRWSGCCLKEFSNFRFVHG